MPCHASHSGPSKPITNTAAWKREHKSVNTTTRWDNYPLQAINCPAVHDEERREGVMVEVVVIVEDASGF